MKGPFDLLIIIQSSSSSGGGPFQAWESHFTGGVNGISGFISTSVMPALGAFFVIMSIMALSKSIGDPEKYFMGGLLCCMTGSILALLQTYTSAPTTALGNFVGYIGNVIMPLYAGWSLVKAICAYGGFLSRLNVGDDWVRHFVVTCLCVCVSGLCKLGDHFIAGVTTS